jgi:5-methylcytosine-specific restriction endonuclease McrA
MSALRCLSSDQLLARLLDLVHRGRELEADLIAHLAEVDARRLYLREGCTSMFAYCVGVLRFAEAVAYKRIAAARAARRYPEVLTALRKGDLHLTAVSLLAPQLTAENASELLAAARHRTADEIRRMLADRQPKPDVVSSVRRLSVSSVPCGSSSRCTPPVGCVSPARFDSSVCAAGRVDPSTARAEIQETPLGKESGFPASPSAQPARSSGAAAPSCGSRGVHPRPPEPLGDERYLIRFTADRKLHAQLQELKSLMRHQIPDGDVGKVLAKAVAVLLKQVRAQKFGECSAPRAARRKRAESAERVEQADTPSPSRQIPAAIRRAVSRRDRERCTFVSATGRRCGSRNFLEFHHRRPWARNRSHAIDGITLRCRAHNQHEAERDFGAKHMEHFCKRDQPETPALLPETAAVLPETPALLPETAALPSDPNSSAALQS